MFPRVAVPWDEPPLRLGKGGRPELHGGSALPLTVMAAISSGRLPPPTAAFLSRASQLARGKSGGSA